MITIFLNSDITLSPAEVSMLVNKSTNFFAMSGNPTIKSIPSIVPTIASTYRKRSSSWLPNHIVAKASSNSSESSHSSSLIPGSKTRDWVEAARASTPSRKALRPDPAAPGGSLHSFPVPGLLLQ